MGVNYNTRIVNRGLAIAVDAANPACVSNKLRKNLLVSPEDFSNAVWGKGNVTVVTNGTVSPDGSITADAIIETTTTSAFHYINQVISKPTVSSTFTFSCYIKNLSNNRLVALRFQDTLASNGIFAVFNPMLGTVTTAVAAYGTGFTAISSTITPDLNGSYRASITGTTNATNSVFVQVEINALATNVYTGDGISGTYLWGAQLEYGSTPDNYYPVSSTGFPTAVTDLSPNKLNGTLVNNVNYDSRNSGALVFDNISAHVDLPQLPSQTNQPLSVFAWVYLNALPAGVTSSGIWGHYGAVGNCHFECYLTYTRIRLGDTNNVTLPIMVTGAWQYVGFTSSGTSHNYYVNGVLTSSWTGTTGTILGGYSPGHFIGKSDLPRPWNGRISHTVIHNAELTATEVLQNFNALKGRYNL